MSEGTGNINGVGVYKFQVCAGGNDPDDFRIRNYADTGTAYDNGMDKGINAGSILAHTRQCASLLCADMCGRVELVG